MNLLETINDFIREHARDIAIYHNIKSKYHSDDNIKSKYQRDNNIIMQRREHVIPLSDNKIEFIKTNNKCYECDNNANYIVDIDNRKINFCWKHSYLYSHE